jgi:hypothetical protein
MSLGSLAIRIDGPVKDYGAVHAVQGIDLAGSCCPTMGLLTIIGALQRRPAIVVAALSA